MFNFKDYNLTDEGKNEISFKLMRIVEEVRGALKNYTCEPCEFLYPPKFKVEETKKHFQQLLNKEGLDFYLENSLVYLLLTILVKKMRKMSVEKAQQERKENSSK